MSDKTDFLDEMVAERSARNADFPRLMEQAAARRELLQMLAARRKERELSQTKVAATMGTSQSFVAKLENTASDTKLSTVEKFASALGLKLQFRLIDESSDEPLVVAHERRAPRVERVAHERQEAVACVSLADAMGSPTPDELRAAMLSGRREP